MRIIALKTLREYWEKEPDSKEDLSAWHQEVLAASWNEPEDIKEKYRSVLIEFYESKIRFANKKRKRNGGK